MIHAMQASLLSRQVTRRTFLGAAAGLALGAANAPERGLAPAADRARQDLFVINMLGAVRNPNPRSRGGPSGALQTGARPGPDARAVADALTSGTAAVNITVGYVAGSQDPFESSVADVARWNRIIRARPESLRKVWTARDIETAAADGRVGLILGFQNAAMMGNDARRVHVFAGLGVKVIQLTYNTANQLGHGSMVPENGGLTDFGRAVVAELNASRTLVDLSHSGEQTCLDGIAASSAPVAITHTGCRAVTDLPRNKTDRELRLVAEGGGIVGIYFMPFLAADGMAVADDVVRHIEHAVQVCGEEHVGIGTDGGTTARDDMEAAYEAARRDVEARRAAGIGATGERAGVVPFIPGPAGTVSVPQAGGDAAGARPFDRARGTDPGTQCASGHAGGVGGVGAPPTPAPPVRGVGNPAAEEQFEAGFRRQRLGCLPPRGPGRQVARDLPYLSGRGVAQDRHRPVAVPVQCERPAGPLQGDAGQPFRPPFLSRHGEDERRASVPVGDHGHLESQREEFGAVGVAAGDQVEAVALGGRGGRVQHERGVEVGRAVGVGAAPEEEDALLRGRWRPA